MSPGPNFTHLLPGVNFQGADLGRAVPSDPGVLQSTRGWLPLVPPVAPPILRANLACDWSRECFPFLRFLWGSWGVVKLWVLPYAILLEA